MSHFQMKIKVTHLNNFFFFSLNQETDFKFLNKNIIIIKHFLHNQVKIKKVFIFSYICLVFFSY